MPIRLARTDTYGHSSQASAVRTTFCGSLVSGKWLAVPIPVPHFGDVPFNLPLVTLTSILRLPDDASGGHSRSAAKVTPGFAGKARSSLLFCEKNLQPYG